MKKIIRPNHVIEVLESRIAPAAIPLTAEWRLATHNQDGSPIPLHAGQGLSTGGPNSGDYLLYIEKGNAWIFTTDLNNDRTVDFNEITGIAAGDGLRMISFVDIHGDIVTNLKEVTAGGKLSLSLSDSNNNPSDDNPEHGGDGRVVLNSRIEKIELRTLTVNDIPDQNNDGIVNDLDVDLRRAVSTHSIFGNIYAGRGFGVPGDPTSGLIIDNTVTTNFGFETETVPSIGSIRVGTAVSGEYFRFSINGGYDISGGVMEKRVRAGIELGDDAQGYIVPFIPAAGQAGASIAYVRSMAADQPFNINGLYAGDGGSSARGGDIQDVTLNGDNAGGYNIIAGNGGSGTTGGAGGSIVRFNDVNSDTSKVVIRSGDGGFGTTGAGGNGGNTDIVNATFYGNYSIFLGDGGDGFTLGGNGASLTKATIEQPVPAGLEAGSGWGTSHNSSYYNANPGVAGIFEANIGTTEGIDIDGDGYGDFVFTTTTTSQLVVMFGSEDGFRRVETPGGQLVPDRLYLASPRNAEAMVVADLNGDGRPDIAAGSSDVSNQAGISVFIAKWQDMDNDGRVDGAADKFLGFYDPRFSPLPVLDEGDNQTFNAVLPHWASPHQILEMVAGDFDGDGANEIAVAVTQYNLRELTNGVPTAVTDPTVTVIFLSPDRELDTNSGKTFLTGNFFADFGTKRVEVSQPDGTKLIADPEPIQPIYPLGRAVMGTVILESTALSTSATHDSLIVGVQGGPNNYDLYTLNFFVRANSTPVVSGAWSLGEVDTNRNVKAGNNENLNDVAIGLLDFAVEDLNGDGKADIIALSQGPNNYVVGLYGTGNGGGSQVSGGAGDAIDQAGFYLGDQPEGRGIKPIDADGDGVVDDFAVLMVIPQGYAVETYSWQAGVSKPPVSGPVFEGVPYTVASNVLTVADYRGGQIVDEVFWDIYYSDPTNLASPGLAIASAGDSFVDVVTPEFGISSQVLSESGLAIYAGDGGDSFVGKAGNGGSIGGKGSIQTEIIDPTLGLQVTDYVGALEIVYDGTVRLYGGNGGLGFSKGGNGGSISGVSFRDSDATIRAFPAYLAAGDGGRGISGTGGAGGDLIANSIEFGLEFIAGDGGVGKIGGRGGAVIGTNLKIGTDKVYDTSAGRVEVYAGQGGNGLKQGGAGGSIVNFSPKLISTVAGDLIYVAGGGGNAVAGPGGEGGSVLNSSPQLNAGIQGQISVYAGDGGAGTRGGKGGSINTFVVTQGLGKNAAILELIAGHGGKGTAGAGGAGGNISLVSAASVGTYFDTISPIGGPSLFTYSRVLAGNGGESIGGTGGVGGTVSKLVTGIVDGTIAIVSGAGGDGLHQGGAGGGLNSIHFTGLAGGTSSKALLVAGAGGDARAFVANPNDPSPDQSKKAFGGRIGRAGAGGSINGVRIDGADGGHFDLIAGNGGDTVHYGNLHDEKSYVGIGGSISNVFTNGNIGNSEEVVPIKSYNDILNGESMKQFVERRIRVGELGEESLSDADGNVGIVVGASGRLKAVVQSPFEAPHVYSTIPAKDGRSGNLTNITASQIMSAVAGNVDRLAAIQLAKDIFVSGGTGVGADKLGAVDFIDEDGVKVDAPVAEGQLIDGALFALKKVNVV